eukprot:2827013-Pyramimonas_sp.AAC.1
MYWRCGAILRPHLLGPHLGGLYCPNLSSSWPRRAGGQSDDGTGYPILAITRQHIKAYNNTA